MQQDTVVIGIVASAGGLEAVSQMVSHLPLGLNATYVLAQHMSPSHESMMAELVRRETQLKVVELSEAVVPETDTIYVTPPKRDVILQDGLLVLAEPSKMPAAPQPSGDRLLVSLAQERNVRSMGIILSGTGSDGSYGIRAIREAGGITIAQDASTAKYDGMPNSATETGCIDLTLSPDQIARHLADILARSPDIVDLQAKRAPDSKLAELMRILLARTGIDFRDYKSNTVSRRIHRRMTALGITDYDDYVTLCRGSVDEVDMLHRVLLISVTRFFRDRDQFEMLQRAIISMVAEKPQGPFRVWVPGVATGEEAYTIAMLFAEAAGSVEAFTQIRLQIFATDVDTGALQIGRAATYPFSSLQDVPEVLRERYFRRHGDRVEVARFIRSCVLFSQHNVAQDPPFLTLDLVSLRNVLIYFNHALQERVLSRIHYALTAGSYLFLGTSETASVMEAYFEQSSFSSKLYIKRRGVRRTPTPMPSHFNMPVANRLHVQSSAPTPMRTEDLVADAMFDALVKSVAKQGFLATRGGDILRVMGDLSPYVQLSDTSGLRMSTRLLREPFRDDVTNLIAISSRNKGRAAGRWREGIVDGLAARLACYPFQLQDRADPVFIVSLETRPHDPSPPLNISKLSEKERLEYLAEIEKEMKETREALQQTVEELKTSNEELQATNEELQSTNEELQATNEELETANEELQSTNEELITVNEEMRVNGD